MSSNELEAIIKEALDNFYQRRLSKLASLKLKETLRKKNPYLFRAIGVLKADEIVECILQAYMSSSDETIFGDAFFEPIAKHVSGGTVSPTEGVDIAIETEKIYKAISVKSGPNIFNSSQAKRMDDEFRTLRSRVSKLHKQFDAVLAHSYGYIGTSNTTQYIYRRCAGQEFWQEITGDPDFYLQLCHLMGNYPSAHRLMYEEEKAKAVNRFTLEFLNDFSTPDGGIDWDAFLRFNSGSDREPKNKVPRKKSTQ